MKPRSTIRVVAVIMIMTTTVALVGLRRVTAQSPSVLDGVYSEAQAARGESVYLLDCAQCHGDNLMGGEGATELVGTPFLERWKGQTLGDLYARIQQTMPLGSPNALSRRAYTDVVAYILSENEFPEGGRELPPEMETLKAIRITAP